MKKSSLFVVSLLISLFSSTNSQQRVLDKFENLKDWKVINSDAATIKVTVVSGLDGNCLKIDYEFLAAGYCGIEKTLPFTLHDNYKFTFFIKGDSPKNNLEFKLIDKSGDNVWWKNQRNFEFPHEWEKITIRKRDIEFAWGPMGGGTVDNFENIQFIVAASEGGKGTIYLDELNFEEIIPPINPDAKPIVYSSIPSNKNLGKILDGDWTSIWQSNTKPERQYLLIDFQFIKEIGSVVLQWDELDFAVDFDISTSNDRVNWDKVFSINNNRLTKNFIHLKSVDARYVKLSFNKSSRKKGYKLKEVDFKETRFSQSLNNFFTYVANNYQAGFFPKYFYNKQSFWTIVGVSEDYKEALINEEGAIEVDKSSFSIEPFIQLKDKFITWNDVSMSQSLEENYLPIPSVVWNYKTFKLNVTPITIGEPNNSSLLIRYQLSNISENEIAGKLFLAIRPFQVNPKSQFLNIEGGVSKIYSIVYEDNLIKVNDEKIIAPLLTPDAFGATKFYDGEIIDYLSKHSLPSYKAVKDDFGFASASISYNFNLSKNEQKEFFVLVPFYQKTNFDLHQTNNNPEIFYNNMFSNEVNIWKEKLDRVRIYLPNSAQKLINTLKSNLAYILINKDGPAIQPGSRSYERSWIRDGALTSSALLRLGLKEEVKYFLDWYSQFQFPSGKIPCVVDKRGADPTPENDSHGEYIYVVLQYFKFTHDKLFLKDKLQHVIGAVNYIEFLTNQRKTEQFKKEDSLVFYGLMPESISHEGYSAKPMHSYWDDFFTLRGLRDAVEIASILNEKELNERFEILYKEFETNLLNSISLSIKNHNIDYIPGCAELGDFDPTSTTIALFPGNEQKLLPQRELANTFDKYYSFFTDRKLGKINWINYTPYEIRIVGSFIYLNQREISYELLNYFFNDQRPNAWNKWAEVVWKNINEPQFIGDMPHTWIGSDYINAVRTMFVYEDEQDTTLVLGAGLKEEWADDPVGITIEEIPTYYGNVSYSVKKIGKQYEISISGNINNTKAKIIFKNFKKEAPAKILIDGKESKNFNQENIFVEKVPAILTISFQE